MPLRGAGRGARRASPAAARARGHLVSDRELAGYVAPILRSTDERVLRRRVKTYDRETGEVTGEVTMREVVGGLAQATALGLEVVEGVRSLGGLCELCGKVLEAPKNGHAPRACPTALGGCRRQAACACGAAPPRAAFTPANVARRKGTPWRCKRCMFTSRVAKVAPTRCAGGCGAVAPHKACLPPAIARRHGRPWRCRGCVPRALAVEKTVCAGAGCSAVAPRRECLPAAITRRGGPWRCRSCARRGRQ